MSLSEREIIVDTISVCKKHLERMNYAKTEIQHLFPLKNIKFDNLPPVTIAYIDQFIGRFAKLQDAMGAKLFPQILDLTQEVTSPAFIDKLNKLEKIGAIPNAEDWVELRTLRNSFAHDYPADLTLTNETLNQALILSVRLENILLNCIKFINKYV